MDILTRNASIRDRVRAWRESGQRIALVPTSGTLHKGHMSLVAEAQDRVQRVIVSIFSDPPQRDGHTHEADRDLLSNVGADVLFIPPVQEVFPIGREWSARVTLPEPDGIGPAGEQLADTVFVKLFNVVQPDLVLFGERDFRLLARGRRLVDDLFMPVEVVACPTLRDSDGLALATVNRDLTPQQRSVAPLFHATLANIAEKIDAGERDYGRLQRDAVFALTSAGFVPDYLAIRQAQDLALVLPEARDLVILAAVWLDTARLTDSVPVRLIDRF